MIKFQRGRSNGYILITPASPLLDLEKFLGDHLFALGTVSSRPTLIHVNENFDEVMLPLFSHRFIKKVCAGGRYTTRLGQLCYKAW